MTSRIRIIVHRPGTTETLVQGCIDPDTFAENRGTIEANALEQFFEEYGRGGADPAVRHEEYELHDETA